MTPLSPPRKPHPVEVLEASDLAALAEWCYDHLDMSTRSCFDLIRNPRSYATEFERWQDWLRDTDPYR